MAPSPNWYSKVSRKQFSAWEGGTLQNIQQLAEDHHCPPPVDHDLFAGRVQVQASNNGITNELLKIGGDVAAMHFVPLVLKCVLHQYMSHCRGKEEPKARARLMTRSRIAPFSCPTGKIPFVPQESIGESLGDIDQVKNGTPWSYYHCGEWSWHRRSYPTLRNDLKRFVQGNPFQYAAPSTRRALQERTRRGGPIADLFFNMAMGLIKRSVRRITEQAGFENPSLHFPTDDVLHGAKSPRERICWSSLCGWCCHHGAWKEQWGDEKDGAICSWCLSRWGSQKRFPNEIMQIRKQKPSYNLQGEISGTDKTKVAVRLLLKALYTFICR